MSKSIKLFKMIDVPAAWRNYMRRDLSLGRDVEDGFQAWTYQDGSCWAALGFAGDDLVCWAAITKQIDYYPVIGCYTRQDHRGKGFAALTIDALLRDLMNAGELEEGDHIFASTHRWRKYTQLIEAYDLVCEQWI